MKEKTKSVAHQAIQRALVLLVPALFLVSCSQAELTPHVPREGVLTLNNNFNAEGQVCSNPADKQTAPAKFIIVIDDSLSNEPVGVGGNNTDPLQDPCATANTHGLTPPKTCNHRSLAALDFIQAFFDPEEGFDPNKEAIVIRFHGQITVCGRNASSGVSHSFVQSGFDSGGRSVPLNNTNAIEFDTLGNIVGCITDPYPNSQGGITSGTLWTETGLMSLAVRDIHQAALASMTQLEALTTGIYTFIFTDGYPDDGDPTRTAYYENVPNVVSIWDDIYDVYNERLREIQFNVIQYGFASLTAQEQAIATSLGLGITDNDERGEYVTIDNLASVRLIDFLSLEFSVGQSISHFFAHNFSAHIRVEDGKATIQADSDGDGLTDLEEAKYYGTKLDKWDSDDDGINDFDEIKTKSNPLVPDAGNCSANFSLDSDKDGLTDCTEDRYGTSRILWDSDRDGIPDYLEVLYGLNPLLNDAAEDPDKDGKSNIIEVSQGTPVDYANDEAIESMAMKYKVHTFKEGTRACLNFEVNNIQTGVTAPDPSDRVGINYITFMSEMNIFNDPLSTIWRQADSQVTFTGEDKIPATALIEVDEREFY
jgi:hypothetical protein